MSADDFVILNIQENSSRYEMTRENPFTIASSGHLSNTSGEEKKGEVSVSEKVNKMTPDLTHLQKKSLPLQAKQTFSRSIVESTNQSSAPYYN